MKQLCIFPFFSVKLSHIKVHTFFSYVTNTQAKHQKLESKEKQSLGRIDSMLKPQKSVSKEMFFGTFANCAIWLVKTNYLFSHNYLFISASFFFST